MRRRGAASSKQTGMTTMTNIQTNQIEALSDAELDNVSGGNPLGDFIGSGIPLSPVAHGLSGAANSIGHAAASVENKIAITRLFGGWHPWTHHWVQGRLELRPPQLAASLFFGKYRVSCTGSFP
jgi:hypothetical protein